MLMRKNPVREFLCELSWAITSPVTHSNNFSRGSGISGNTYQIRVNVTGKLLPHVSNHYLWLHWTKRLCGEWTNRNLYHDTRPIILMLVGAITWSCWKERNAKVFFGKHASICSVAYEGAWKWKENCLCCLMVPLSCWCVSGIFSDGICCYRWSLHQCHHRAVPSEHEDGQRSVSDGESAA